MWRRVTTGFDVLGGDFSKCPFVIFVPFGGHWFVVRSRWAGFSSWLRAFVRNFCLGFMSRTKARRREGLNSRFAAVHGLRFTVGSGCQASRFARNGVEATKRHKRRKEDGFWATKNTKFLHPCVSLPRAYRRIETFLRRTEFCVFCGHQWIEIFERFEPFCGH